MTSDYVDNWDALPPTLQDALAPIVARFATAADAMFDRRLNLSFEAAVRELSIPGIVDLTQALRELRSLLQTRVTVPDTAPRELLLFDGTLLITTYDLPLYTPCLYLSQLAQAMQEENVRVWKLATAEEIIAVLLEMARCVRPDIETARVCIAAVHDMVMLYPAAQSFVTDAAAGPDPNTAHIATQAAQLIALRI